MLFFSLPPPPPTSPSDSPITKKKAAKKKPQIKEKDANPPPTFGGNKRGRDSKVEEEEDSLAAEGIKRGLGGPHPGSGGIAPASALTMGSLEKMLQDFNNKIAEMDLQLKKTSRESATILKSNEILSIELSEVHFFSILEFGSLHILNYFTDEESGSRT